MESRFAKASVSVELRGISLYDNSIGSGGIVSLVDSHLKTYQVRTKLIS